MHLRVARHTSDLNKLQDFYTKVLGFQVIGGFQGHSGYDGVFLSYPAADWHLEFTYSKELPNHSPDPDDALILYPASHQEYKNIMSNLKSSKTQIISSKNPYWNENGMMIQDPDGFYIVISPQKIIE